MTIHYLMQVQAEIAVDNGLLCYKEMSNEPHPIQDYIDKANWLIGEYGFENAIIYDVETEEIYVEMERDANDCYPDDDDLPEYYDDGDTCGYE